jgi:polycystin 2
MFLAIINDTYSEVKEDISSSDAGDEMGDFFKRGYEKVLTKLNVKKDRIIDIKDALKNADKDGDNKLNYDELRTELKVSMSLK